MHSVSIHPGRQEAKNKGQKYPKDTSKPCLNRPKYMKRSAAYDARVRDFNATVARDPKNAAAFTKPGSWK